MGRRGRGGREGKGGRKKRGREGPAKDFAQGPATPKAGPDETGNVARILSIVKIFGYTFAVTCL
jgi:hypothetical protein